MQKVSERPQISYLEQKLLIASSIVTENISNRAVISVGTKQHVVANKANFVPLEEQNWLSDLNESNDY